MQEFMVQVAHRKIQLIVDQQLCARDGQGEILDVADADVRLQKWMRVLTSLTSKRST